MTTGCCIHRGDDMDAELQHKSRGRDWRMSLYVLGVVIVIVLYVGALSSTDWNLSFQLEGAVAAHPFQLPQLSFGRHSRGLWSVTSDQSRQSWWHVRDVLRNL